MLEEAVQLIDTYVLPARRDSFYAVCGWLSDTNDEFRDNLQNIHAIADRITTKDIEFKLNAVCIDLLVNQLSLFGLNVISYDLDVLLEIVQTLHGLDDTQSPTAITTALDQANTPLDALIDVLELETSLDEHTLLSTVIGVDSDLITKIRITMAEKAIMASQTSSASQVESEDPVKVKVRAFFQVHPSEQYRDYVSTGGTTGKSIEHYLSVLLEQVEEQTSVEIATNFWLAKLASIGTWTEVPEPSTVLEPYVQDTRALMAVVRHITSMEASV